MVQVTSKSIDARRCIYEPAFQARRNVVTFTMPRVQFFSRGPTTVPHPKQSRGMSACGRLVECPLSGLERWPAPDPKPTLNAGRPMTQVKTAAATAIGPKVLISLRPIAMNR